MKKNLKHLFTALLLLCATVAGAERVTIDGINYNLDTEEKTATVVYRSYSGDVVIPASVDYNGTICSVTSIGKRAFYECSSLTSVTIPNSVTSIGTEAFYCCSSLTSITIPNGVTSISNYTFWYCSSLTNVTIPNSVTSIRDYAFEGCSSLKNVTIPDSVTSIGEYAFALCSFTSVTIPNGVTIIDEGTFSGCSSLTSVTIPNNVTNIGVYAFRECQDLTIVIIPNSVTSIYHFAFEDCYSLTDVYCLATELPEASSDIFYGSYPEYITLHVPAEAIKKYKATEPWNLCGAIRAIKDNEIPVYVASQISYSNGKLSVDCTNGTITISCSLDGEAVAVYTTGGVLVGTATIENGLATVATGLSKGTIAIVKIGKKSMKVII